jgi:hypothetical protein
MFAAEQGNRLWMNATGHSHYMSAIRHQCRGFAWAGDDTDQTAAALVVLGVALFMEKVKVASQNLTGQKTTY